MDIGIYTREEVLEHKKNDGKASDECYCYWEFAWTPEMIEGDKIFFATEGKWQGYFIIHRAWSHEVEFYSETWHELKEKPERKPFQGFTYKVPET